MGSLCCTKIFGERRKGLYMTSTLNCKPVCMSVHAPHSVLILWTVVSGTFTTEATVYGVNMALACSTTLIFDCVRVPMAVTIQVGKNVDYLKGTLVYAHPLPSSSPF